MRKIFVKKRPYGVGPAGARKRDSRPGDSRQGDARGGPRFFQKKTCRFCGDRVESLDYKEPDRLTRFLTEKGKILPRRITGNCAKHQRILVRAIKRARHAALIAFQME